MRVCVRVCVCGHVVVPQWCQLPVCAAEWIKYLSRGMCMYVRIRRNYANSISLFSVVYVRVGVCALYIFVKKRGKNLGKLRHLHFLMSPFHFEGSDGIRSIILAKLEHLPPRRWENMFVLLIPVSLHNLPGMTFILHTHMQRETWEHNMKRERLHRCSA